MLESFGMVSHITPATSKLIGKKINRITIAEIGKKINSYRYAAICFCECGAGPFIVRLDKITSCHTKSCGCLHLESITTHGCWGHPLFPVWSHMMSRCYKKSDKRFNIYGKRGIIVCERWHTVNNFIEDMAASFKDGLQLDREDNDGNYEPDNCRWATPKQQQRNRSNNRRITINGETKVLSEWCEIYGAPYWRTYERIYSHQWEPLRALTEKAKRG